MSKKKDILLDADGVFVDFVGGVLKIVKDLTQKELAPEQFPTWEIMDKLEGLTGVAGLEADVRHYIGRPGFCYDLAPCPGAEAALKKLIELEEGGKINIIIATSPWTKSATWMHERTQWFEARGLHRHRVMHTDVKHPIYADMFIDDKPSHVEAWVSRWGNAGFLWDTPHNRYETSLRRMKGWEEFFEVLLPRLR